MTVPHAIRLPFVPRPNPHEFITSWLERCAAAYGQRWKTFSASLGMKPELAIDYCADHSLLERIALSANIGIDDLAALDLAEAFPDQPSHRFVFKPKTHRADPGYCPRCLVHDNETNSDSFLRHEWALAGVGHCLVHRAVLHTRCHHCSLEIQYHWRAVGSRSRVYCDRCGGGLHDRPSIGSAIWDDINLSTAVFEAEHLIVRALGASLPGIRKLQRDFLISFLAILEDVAYFIDRDVPGSGYHLAPKRTINSIASVMVGLHRHRNGLSAPDGYPLADRSATSRAWLLAACLYVLFSDRIMSVRDAMPTGIVPMLEWLTSSLDEEGKRALLKRAKHWVYIDECPFKRIWSVQRGALAVQRIPIYTLSLWDMLTSLRKPLEKQRDREAQRACNEEVNAKQRDKARRHSHLLATFELCGYQTCHRR